MTRIGIQRPLTVSYMVALEQWNICRFQTIYKMSTVVRLLWSEMFKSKIVYLKSKQPLGSVVFILFFLFFVHTAILSIKTAFNLVKIHIYYSVLCHWFSEANVLSSMFLSFLGTEIYTLSVFRIYAVIQGWRTNEDLCNKLNP